MSVLEFINLREVLEGIARSQKSIRDAQLKAAKQMGITATQNIQNLAPDPLRVKTGAWQSSIDYHIEEINDLDIELTVGSNGVEQYYFVQEALHHPIEIGWHKSLPELEEIYKKNMVAIK